MKADSRMLIPITGIVSALFLFPALVSAATDENPPAETGAAAETDSSFQDLLSNSPFLRPLNLSNSLIVTGLANVEGETLATIFDKQDETTTLVTDATGNERGMRIVGISRDRRSKQIALKVSVRGDEVQIPFDVDALLPRGDSKSSGEGDRRGDGRGDGRRGDGGRGSYARPPQEIMDKYNSLSGDQRGAYWRWANSYYQKHPELRRSEKRFPIVNKALDAIKAGRTPDIK